MHAIVLLNVERDKVNDIAELLADIKGVSEVFSVAGRLDLVALIRVRGNEDLANIVTPYAQDKGYPEHGDHARLSSLFSP